MEVYGEGKQQTLLVVAKEPDEALQRDLSRHLHERLADPLPQVKLLDRAAFASIRGLIAAGVLNPCTGGSQILYRGPEPTPSGDDGQSKRLTETLALLEQGKHRRAMAKVLNDGGFPREALVPMREAVDTALQALLLWRGDHAETCPRLDVIESTLVRGDLLPADYFNDIGRLRDRATELAEHPAGKLFARGDIVFLEAASVLSDARTSRP